MTAGPVAEFVFPGCACDACDETAEPVADDLVATVFAVVAGHLRQRVERRGHGLVPILRCTGCDFKTVVEPRFFEQLP